LTLFRLVTPPFRRCVCTLCLPVATVPFYPTLRLTLLPCVPDRVLTCGTVILRLRFTTTTVPTFHHLRYLFIFVDCCCCCCSLLLLLFCYIVTYVVRCVCLPATLLVTGCWLFLRSTPVAFTFVYITYVVTLLPILRSVTIVGCYRLPISILRVLVVRCGVYVTTVVTVVYFIPDYAPPFLPPAGELHRVVVTVDHLLRCCCCRSRCVAVPPFCGWLALFLLPVDCRCVAVDLFVGVRAMNYVARFGWTLTAFVVTRCTHTLLRFCVYPLFRCDTLFVILRTLPHRCFPVHHYYRFTGVVIALICSTTPRFRCLHHLLVTICSLLFRDR